ncbi:MAG: fumarylacetoacetate hydrolase family protein [Propionibacteriaceae bacterium]|jgi:2-keto-4-pentenoate hydratase|nr:fumarylacetoacetate hydrolase family protein [Propionibacteriaceae bacterium]
MSSSIELRLAAQHLVEAQQTGQLAAPIHPLLHEDLEAAYDVQELVLSAQESTTNPRVGRKLGLISAAAQARLQASQPCFGVLLNDMDASGWVEIPESGLRQPKIQAEVAFILHTDITSTDLASVEAAVMSVVPALSIVDHRVGDGLTVTDYVADNLGLAYFVAGFDRVPLIRIKTDDIAMKLTINGQVQSTGHVQDGLGDAIHGLVWLAQAAADLGRPLRAGEIILSGTLGPLMDFPPGAEVEAELSGLGRVTAARD